MTLEKKIDWLDSGAVCFAILTVVSLLLATFFAMMAPWLFLVPAISLGLNQLCMALERKLKKRLDIQLSA